jgi:hypothetical protein
MNFRGWIFLLAAALAAAANADEASVKRAVEGRFGGIKPSSVTKTPYAGLYEIVLGDTIFYTDEKVSFVFRGDIIDAHSQQNLTEERQRKLSTISFGDLPLELAIKQVRRSSPIRSVRIARTSTGRSCARTTSPSTLSFTPSFARNPPGRLVPSGAPRTGPRRTTTSC